MSRGFEAARKPVYVWLDALGLPADAAWETPAAYTEHQHRLLDAFIEIQLCASDPIRPDPATTAVGPPQLTGRPAHR